jgi:tetratricopeptide (TPR) repeat protein
LAVALVIAGAAYVVGEWTQTKRDETLAPRPSKFRRLAAAQIMYLTETNLGGQAEAKKRYDEAVDHYRRALLAQDNAEGHLILGKALLKQGNPDMAFGQFKEALRLNPGYEDVYVAWGQALKFQGKTEESAQLYEDALRQNPKLALVHYNLAVVLEQQEQIARAAEHAAEGANPPQAVTNSVAGTTIFGLAAGEHYAEAERLGMDTPDFWRSYGTLLNKQGKYAQAEVCLRKAVVQQPGSGAAQFQLALAQQSQGNYADAIEHYEETLVALPDDAPTLNNLALLYATATNPEARSSKMAVFLATRACDATTGQNARYMDTLARAYAADGDFFQAIAWEDKAVRRAAQLSDHDLLRELQPRFHLFVQHKSE